MPRVLGATGALLAALLLGLAFGSDCLTAMSVFGPAAATVWWVRTRTPIQAPLMFAGVLLGSLAGCAVILSGITAWLQVTVPGAGWHAPWWAMGSCVGLVVVVTHLRARYSLSDTHVRGIQRRLATAG